MNNSPLKKILEELSKVRKSSILTIIIPNSSLSPTHLLKVKSHVKDKKFKTLDIIIHSSGGDIHTAFQICELLRNHTDHLNSIVPLYAKSAATLMTISSDEIIMGDLAELGPLDTQIAERKIRTSSFRA